MISNYANLASRVYQNTEIILKPYYSPFSLLNDFDSSKFSARFSDNFRIFLDSGSQCYQIINLYNLEDDNWLTFKLKLAKKELKKLEYSHTSYEEASITLKFNFTNRDITIRTRKIPIQQSISFLKEIIFIDTIIPDNILENYWSTS